jgi:CheY-like chemotaxis protein
MHDVNNALNPIMAAAYLLDVNADNPAAVRDYATRIAKAAETGAATAARVGRFIRQEPLQGERDEEVDLSVVCDEVVALTRPIWAERARGGTVHLERDLADGAMVNGIAGELREAMLNLVQNALDAMEGGGTLGLRTYAGEQDVRLEVRDSGIGMTAEVRERAFEPFFTTKGRAGTGLGLAEVYGIVKRHRGRAEIESMPGAGTIVRLIFPRLVSDRSSDAAGDRPQSAARRVLLVEDQTDSRDFMRAVLESDGHRVDAVGGVEEALQLLDGASSAYDVLVTDIGLSDRSGWELVTTVRDRWPSIRVGIVTGWEPGAGAGADGDFVLRKPVRTSELLAHVAALD